MPTRFSWNKGMTWLVVGKAEGIQGIEIAQVFEEVIGCPEYVPARIWGAVGSTFFLGAFLINK